MWPWEDPYQADVMPVAPQVSPEVMNLPWIPGQAQVDASMPVPLPATPESGQGANTMLASMGDVVNPSSVQKAPPASPQEYEQRKAGWQTFLDRMQNDPQARMALMVGAARMMQGRKQGQSTGGAIADSIMMGMGADQMMDYNKAQAAIKEREMGMKEAESGARVESVKANTARTRQGTEFDAQEQPLKLEKLQRDAKVSALKLRAAELEAVVQEYEARNDPDGAKRFKQAQDKVKAELARIQAQTQQASSGAAENSAQARLYGAQADQADQMAKWQKTLTDPKATEDEKAQAERNIQLFKRSQGGGSSAQVMNRADLARQYSITLGKPVGSKEVTEAVLNHEKTKQKADLEEQYAKYLETQTATSPAQEEAAWKRWVAMKRRFGVDVESVMGTKAGKDAKSGGGTVEMVLDPKTGKYVIKQ